MRREFKFNQEDLLEVIGEVSDQMSDMLKRLDGIAISLKEIEEAYVGGNLFYDDEFYLGNLEGILGEGGELVEIYGFIDNTLLNITEVVTEGITLYSANYVSFKEENVRFPSGWTISI